MDPSEQHVVLSGSGVRARSSFAVAAVCLAIGITACAYVAVLFRFPTAFAALNLPAYVIVISLPLISIIALTAGVASVVAARRHPAHLVLAVTAACMNFAAAAYGLLQFVVGLWEFNRVWSGSGLGP